MYTYMHVRVIQCMCLDGHITEATMNESYEAVLDASEKLRDERIKSGR